MSSRLVKQQLTTLQAEAAAPSKGVTGAAAGVQKRKQRKQRKALAKAAAKQPAQGAKGVRARNLAYYKATAGGAEDTATAELMAQVQWATPQQLQVAAARKEWSCSWYRLVYA